ncbi:MAG: esterase/lipase family protein, partial [Nitrososphaerales archaeon]
PIPIQLPNGNVKHFNLSNLLGANPGSSVINTLVTSDIQTFATKMNGTIVKSYYSPGGVPLRDLSVPAMGQQTAFSTWTYESSNSNWVITQMVSHPKVTNGTATQTISFANVTWSDNSSNDSARASKGNTSQTPPSPTNLTPSGPSSITNPNPTIVNHLLGSQNVIFQHGLLSDSSTWSRMVTWLNGDFLFGTEIIPSLKSTDPLANQSTALESEITSVGGNQYILIGHSQGGLISRGAAQFFQANKPGTASGVITVDSPNQGADLAFDGQVAVAFLVDEAAFQLLDDLSCLDPSGSFDDFGCFIAALAAEASGPMADYALTQGFPATADLVPGSAFLTNLNSQAENFTRTGVVSFTPERWVFTRIADNALDSFLGANCNPEDICGARSRHRNGGFLRYCFCAGARG